MKLNEAGDKYVFPDGAERPAAVTLPDGTVAGPDAPWRAEVVESSHPGGAYVFVTADGITWFNYAGSRLGYSLGKPVADFSAESSAVFFNARDWWQITLCFPEAGDSPMAAYLRDERYLREGPGKFTYLGGGRPPGPGWKP